MGGLRISSGYSCIWCGLGSLKTFQSSLNQTRFSSMFLSTSQKYRLRLCKYDARIGVLLPLTTLGGRNGWKLNHSPVGLAHFQTVATTWDFVM